MYFMYVYTWNAVVVGFKQRGLGPVRHLRELREIALQ